MYERLNKCPLCKSGLFLNHQVVKDHSISKESFVICRCESCGLLFTNPRPKQEHISEYYQSKEYISHQDESSSLINFVYKQVRNITIRNKVKLINQLKPKQGRLLDYGSGTGYFLQAAIRSGWKGTGFEPNQTAIKTAHQKHKLNLIENMSDLEQERKFDIITLFHVLEHVHELRNTLKLLVEKLKKDSFLILALPNMESLDAKIYQDDWAAWDVPRHLYHFNQNSVEFIAQSYKLKIIQKKPMIYDAYYVSWLSEQFRQKNSIQSAWNAMKTGWRSNQAAKSENNYSSILYILKKK